jgi:hypothetical protein
VWLLVREALEGSPGSYSTPMATPTGREASLSSRWEMERDLERRLFQVQDRCLGVLRWLFALAIPLTIVNISFAAAYAWIYANQVSFPHRTRQSA